MLRFDTKTYELLVLTFHSLLFSLDAEIVVVATDDASVYVVFYS